MTSALPLNDRTIKLYEMMYAFTLIGAFLDRTDEALFDLDSYAWTPNETDPEVYFNDQWLRRGEYLLLVARKKLAAYFNEEEEDAVRQHEELIREIKPNPRGRYTVKDLNDLLPGISDTLILYQGAYSGWTSCMVFDESNSGKNLANLLTLARELMVALYEWKKDNLNLIKGLGTKEE